MRSALALLFASQFVILDLAFQGAPRIAWLESLATGAFVLLLCERRVIRVVAAVACAFVFVSQVYVWRFYHVPLDVQVAASALHQWAAIKGVIWRAIPGVAAMTSALALIELGVLSLAHGRSFRALRMPVFAAAALAGLFGGPPRRSTPEIRALNALWALHGRKAALAGDIPRLPPLYTERDRLPHVLVVLSESIRADDYNAATAPETLKIPGRVDLRQMRAIASYTALSFSAVVTGRSQEGPRADILRSPSMFDYAHAVRDPKGRHFATCHVSGQSEEVFETKEMRTNIDDFTAAETFMGHDPEEDDPPRAMDDVVVDTLIGKLPKLPRPIFAFLHFTDTHAPYYVDPAHAPFVPYDHITAWSKMDELHNAYKDSIFMQDRALARAVDAFVAQAGTEPWIVIFTSDHGEAFSDHGAIHHGQNLYDEQVHVPGWIASGNGALDEKQKAALADHADRFVTHLDLLPTLLDAMGLYDVFGVDKSKLRGKSLLRPWTAREAFPITNCTEMFPCPMNTWGLLENDHKLQARIFDTSWTCTVTGPGPERSVGDSTCERLRSESKKLYPVLPNGQPNP